MIKSTALFAYRRVIICSILVCDVSGGRWSQRQRWARAAVPAWNAWVPSEVREQIDRNDAVGPSDDHHGCCDGCNSPARRDHCRRVRSTICRIHCRSWSHDEIYQKLRTQFSAQSRSSPWIIVPVPYLDAKVDQSRLGSSNRLSRSFTLFQGQLFVLAMLLLAVKFFSWCKFSHLSLLSKHNK